MSAPMPHPLLQRLGPGSAVAVDLRCPNMNCRDAPVIHGSAVVVNEYAVKDPRPKRCPRCGVSLRVAEFIDLDGDHDRTPEPQATPGSGSISGVVPSPEEKT